MASLLNTPFRAFCAPMAVFMLLLALTGFVQDEASPHFWRAHPAFWVYPIQTILVGILILMGWRHYRLKWRDSVANWALSIGVAILVLVIWISPQLFFGFAPREGGFDPTRLPEGSSEYWATVVMRFLRLVIIVPIMEEVFWRGFLMRYFINEDFEKVPVGTYTPLSFWGVAVAFALVHQVADMPAALVTGVLYNWLAIRTRSIALCIVAHAITNLILGIYIMRTGQWGFW